LEKSEVPSSKLETNSKSKTQRAKTPALFALAEDGAEDARQFVGFVDEPIALGLQFAVIKGIHQTQEVLDFPPGSFAFVSDFLLIYSGLQ
jgi:hypothetical protein